ncbi:MAG TPA: hypothetical protein DEA08_29895, partial [Planctomycetes bacterium]|nr:hypothetical protein [Planctomycetota bacterium]
GDEDEDDVPEPLSPEEALALLGGPAPAPAEARDPSSETGIVPALELPPPGDASSEGPVAAAERPLDETGALE